MESNRNSIIEFPHAKGIVVSGDIHGDIITHTSPSFCELSSHFGLEDWAMYDKDLMEDVKYEREVMDDIYNYLYTKNHPLRYWYYGHFHESWHEQINDTMFHLLDIMELREIPSLNDCAFI